MTESEIEAVFVKGIEDAGGLALKLALAGRRGFPDRTVVFPHWIAFVELKRDGGKLSRQQLQWIETLQGFGFDCVVLEGIDEVNEYLEAL